MSLFYTRFLALIRHGTGPYLVVVTALLFSPAWAYSQPPGIIVTVAGTGSPGFGGDGGPASQAQLHLTFGLSADAFGSIYLADAINYRIRKITMDGTITTVAGIGTYGFAGDGGPARQAKLDTPFDVTVDAAGVLYIADTFNHRIRRVGPDGVITTIAGRSGFGFSGDGGPVPQAKLQSPFGVSVGPDGSVYIADTFNHRIRRVGPDGIITTVAGNGQAGYEVDGMPARESSLFNPKSVTIDETGDLFIADTDNHRARRVGSDGLITTVLGDGLEGYGGDGGPAIDTRLHEPYDFITDLNGSVYVSDSHNYRVRRVGGTLRTLFVNTNPEGLGVSFTATEDVFGYAVGPSPVRRQYAYGHRIDLSAPGTAGGMLFQKWTRNGHDLSPVSDLTNNMTENDFLTAVYVVPPDTIPPALIGGLSLQWQEQAVRLQWEETPDKDLDVYMLFRNEAPNVSITDLLTALPESKAAYTDTAIEFGQRYVYRLAVMDTAGNRSHLSALFILPFRSFRTPFLLSRLPA